MTDTKLPSENDSKTTSETEKQSNKTKDETSSSTLARASQVKKTPASSTRQAARVQKQPISKLAVLAVLLSLTAMGGIGGGYYWLQQEKAVFQQSVLGQAESLMASANAENQQLLAAQKAMFEQKLSTLETDIAQKSNVMIEQLQATVNRLNATQPTDWLIHEAEYLIRVAGRTLWLEKETSGAIGLLQEADARLAQLKDPKYLSVREIIHQDIEALKLLPTLNTEQIILSLMGLAEQVDNLPLALAYLPTVEEAEPDFELSENTADWRENLSKTWQRFLADFITVRRRSADVEPLLSPQQKQHLFANLKLKLQQTQWASTKGKAALYQQSLTDIQTWLTRYFDTDSTAYQSFYQSVEMLKTEQVNVEFPTELQSLSAIRQLLNNNQYYDAQLLPAKSTGDEKAEQLLETNESGESSTPAIETPGLEQQQDIKQDFKQEKKSEEKLVPEPSVQPQETESNQGAEAEVQAA